MKLWAEMACEELDAGFFSGDTFDSEEDLKEVADYVQRWGKSITERLHDINIAKEELHNGKE